MRELKFRAWDGKHFWLFDLGDWRLDGGTLFLHDFPGEPPVHLADCVIEQFTGLHDKNGRDIYEGDILGGLWDSPIVWCPKCGGFQLDFAGECAQCSGDVYWRDVVEDDGKLEVIGNIHENPDLMEAR